MYPRCCARTHTGKESLFASAAKSSPPNWRVAATECSLVVCSLNKGSQMALDARRTLVSAVQEMKHLKALPGP